MPDKNEIERRKQIARELSIKAQQEFESSLPTSRKNFIALFDHLDEALSQKECDDTLALSVQFLRSANIANIEEITQWLEDNGGGCDCEVLYNVEEKFDNGQ